MKPEELKIIAEGMGYTASITDSECLVHFSSEEESYWYKYEPDTTNDTQCMEIMNKHEGDIDIAEKISGIEVALHVHYTKTYYGKGKTINEAVCRAKLAQLKQLEDRE